MHLMRRSILCVVAGIAAATVGSSVALSGLVVTSITSLGVQADGRYHLRLAGTFDSPADVVAVAMCDGQLTSAAVHSATRSALEVSIPTQRGTPRCMFSVHRLTDGAVSGPSILLDALGDNEIRGSVDRGVTSTRHGMELYGSFPQSATLNLSVFCVQGGDLNRTQTPYTPDVHFDLRSPTQLNLTFADIPSAGAHCSFTPTNPATGRATGPRWGPLPIHPNDTYALAGFGAYHWPLGAAVGPDADDALASGQRWVSRAGFNAGRVWMAPSIRMRGANGNNPYHLDLDVLEEECPVVPQPCGPGTDCNASPAFLPCAARSSAYQRLFRSPHLRYIVLTVADSASSGDYGSVTKLRTPAWFRVPANLAKVTREYRDLALALYETQRDTGKTFIVSSWETDNAIYGCGSSCTDISETFDAYVQWFTARKQGILQARTIAQARGISGVTVSDAIEFNNLLKDGPKTIDQIIPTVMPEYMTYSAWGSSGGGPIDDPNAGGQLDRDLIRLAARFPNNKPQLLIGELGPADYTGEDPNTARGKNDAWQMAQNARAVQRAQLPVNILWAAYDNAPDEHGNLLAEGLLSADGRERNIVRTLRTELLAGQRELLSPHTARIGGIIVTRAEADGALWISSRCSWTARTDKVVFRILSPE